MASSKEEDIKEIKKVLVFFFFFNSRPPKLIPNFKYIKIKSPASG